MLSDVHWSMELYLLILYLVFTKLTDLPVCTLYKNRSFINIIDWNDFVHTAQQCRQGVCVSQYCTCCFNDTLNRSLGVSVTHNTWCGDNTLPSSVGVSPSTCYWKDTLHTAHCTALKAGVSPSTCSCNDTLHSSVGVSPSTCCFNDTLHSSVGVSPHCS